MKIHDVIFIFSIIVFYVDMNTKSILFKNTKRFKKIKYTILNKDFVLDNELYKKVLSKKVNKKKVSYSIDAETVSIFAKVATEKKYNKSQIIENLLKSFLQIEQEQEQEKEQEKN